MHILALLNHDIELVNTQKVLTMNLKFVMTYYDIDVKLRQQYGTVVKSLFCSA